METKPGTDYFISKKDRLVLIYFSGPLDLSALPVMERCLAELKLPTFGLGVISLKAVPSIESDVVKTFAKILQLIRHKPSELRLCDVHEPVAKLLTERGLLNKGELVPHIYDVVEVEILKALLKRAA